MTKMINKMVFKDWELQQSDSGNFKVVINLIKVRNQFGGNWNIEKAFRDRIRNVDAYYNGGDEPHISTEYAPAKETLQHVKDVLYIINQLNIWIDDENYIRMMDKDMLHKKLTQKLYPIPEKER